MTVLLSNDLYQLDGHLEKLMHSPQKLENERRRFNKTPEGTPPRSGASTINTLSGYERNPDQPTFGSWELEVEVHRTSSQPLWMFYSLSELERRRMSALYQIYRGPPESAPPDEDGSLARQRVKQRWIDQGVWRNGWYVIDIDHDFSDTWAHEDSPTVEDDECTKDDKSGEKQGLDREASRPLNQFLYDIKKEKEWFEECRKAGATNVPSEKGEIESRAYDIIRRRWKHYHLWDDRWGRLPGPAWRHEMSLQTLLRQKFEDFPELVSMDNARRKSFDSVVPDETQLRSDDPRIEILFIPKREEKDDEDLIPIRQPRYSRQSGYRQPKRPGTIQRYLNRCRRSLRSRLGFLEGSRQRDDGGRGWNTIWRANLGRYSLFLTRNRKS